MKHLPSLPAERTLKVIGGRWKALILYHLLQRRMRLTDLERVLSTASQKVLIQQLREMERHGLVRRDLSTDAQYRVLYAVTDLGRTLEPVLAALCLWGRQHAAQLNELHRLADCDLEAVARTRENHHRSPAQRQPAHAEATSEVPA
jgi:DNA-binding HxlR family transcriptional regulator